MGNWATMWGASPALFSTAGFFPILKILGLGAIVFTTNPGTGRRFHIMWQARERLGILELAVEWIAVLAAMLIVAFHPNPFFRLAWGMAIAASTAVEWLFHRLTGNPLTLFDVMSLVEVKNWTSDVSDVMKRRAYGAGILFLLVVLMFFLPAGPETGRATLAIDQFRGAWLPWVCIGFVVIENLTKRGVTHSPMPSQFNLLALLPMNALKSYFTPLPPRRSVAWTPEAKAKKQNIVLLVDESVRGDYVSVQPGNQLTPGLAALSDLFTCFGPALSGGNCSSYSNIILRFGALPERLGETAQTNPSLFAYARKAGYRTIYIDAQVGYQAKSTGMQNYMTLAEKCEIDGFYVLHNGPGLKPADLQLADVIAAELKSAEPVFIYANKDGVHYPYENRCPIDEEVFEPATPNQHNADQAGMISTYRNAISFAVQKFMLYLFAEADLRNTTLIYTSDHGQWFSPNHFPHGAVMNPDPRTGIVPLWAYSSDKEITKAFRQGAELCRGRANHYLIAPTLYELMGYARDDIAKVYEGSMFTGTRLTPRLSTGDIFGFFSTSPLFWEVDLSKDYFEYHAQPKLKSERPGHHPQGSDQVLTLV